MRSASAIERCRCTSHLSAKPSNKGALAGVAAVKSNVEPFPAFGQRCQCGEQTSLIAPVGKRQAGFPCKQAMQGAFTHIQACCPLGGSARVGWAMG